MVEHFNRILGECIAKLVQDNHKKWDQFIHSVLLAYWTKQYKATGKTPFYLVYGWQAILPLNLKLLSEISRNNKNPLTD